MAPSPNDALRNVESMVPSPLKRFLRPLRLTFPPPGNLRAVIETLYETTVVVHEFQGQTSVDVVADLMCAFSSQPPSYAL